MTSHLWTRALLALALGAAGSWQAGAAEFHCRNGDQERRIEVNGPGAAEGRACEVRYWRDATVAGGGRVLWYAQQDADYCAPKAERLVARLESGGWTCTAGAPAAAAEPERTEAAAAPPAEAPAPTAPEVQTATVPAPDVPEPTPESAAAAEPDEMEEAAASTTDTPTEPEVEEAAAHAAATAEAASEAAPEPAARGLENAEPAALASGAADLAATAPAAPPPAPERHAATPAEPVVPLDAHPSAALLDEVLQETLRSVEELYGGAYEAEHAAFGDLDGDGAADAAVLITYQPERDAYDEYVQYLVAYRFNGETFQSVATRNVGGRFLDAVRADLEGIADRRIVVALEVADEGAACCTTRRTAFSLQRGQLVEVADPDRTDVDETSQSEGASPG